MRARGSRWSCTSITDREVALQRLALRIALREGGAIAQARAGARFRLVAADRAGDRDDARASEARRAVGRALRRARARQACAGAASLVEIPVRARHLPLRRRLALAAVAAAMIGWAAIDGEAPRATGSPADARAAPIEASWSRGRVAEAPSLPVLSAIENSPPVPAAPAGPTVPAAPIAEPIAAGAAPAAAPEHATVAAPARSTAGHGPSVGTAAASPPIVAPQKRATPTIAPPAPLVAGATRLSILVYDGVTGAPIGDACVAMGANDCGPQRLHTDALGRWYVDARPTKGTTWEVRIFAPGYRTEVRIVVTQSEPEAVSIFRLRRA